MYTPGSHIQSLQKYYLMVNVIKQRKKPLYLQFQCDLSILQMAIISMLQMVESRLFDNQYLLDMQIEDLGFEIIDVKSLLAVQHNACKVHAHTLVWLLSNDIVLTLSIPCYTIVISATYPSCKCQIWQKFQECFLALFTWFWLLEAVLIIWQLGYDLGIFVPCRAWHCQVLQPDVAPNNEGRQLWSSHAMSCTYQ